MTWGLGYRYIEFNNKVGFPLNYDKQKRYNSLPSAFLQDKISLIHDRLFLTVGTKYERNDYTGAEYQPSTRLLWTPNKSHSVWLAVSRAVSTPSRADDDLGGMFLEPAHDLKSEEVVAHELGYRVAPSARLYLDFSGLYNEHEKIKTNEEISPSMFQRDNKLKGISKGGEISVNYKISSRGELTGGYSHLSIDLEPDPVTTDTGVESLYEGNFPRDQVHLRSYVNLPYNMEFDLMYYYVDNLRYANPSDSSKGDIKIHSYERVDVRLGWSYNDIDVSLAVQNLFDDRHQEIEVRRNIPEEIERSAYLKLSWQH